MRIQHPKPEIVRLLNRAEVAALFGVTGHTVSRWCDQGLLTAVRTLGGHHRFLEAEVMSLLAASRQQGMRSDPGPDPPAHPSAPPPAASRPAPPPAASRSAPPPAPAAPSRSAPPPAPAYLGSPIAAPPRRPPPRRPPPRYQPPALTPPAGASGPPPVQGPQVPRRTRYGPDPGPPAVQPGIQPEANGLLQCLICGRWYRQLGQHVVTKHQVSADAYRRDHGLAASHGLQASDLLAARREAGRQRYRNDPEARRRLVPVNTTLPERVEASRRARRESAARAQNRATATEAGHRAHEAWIASIDARYEAIAAEHGFTRIGEFLDAHAQLSSPRLAALCGVTTKQIQNLRRRYGRRPPGRWPAGYVVRHPSMLPPIQAEDLEVIPSGIQPVRPGGHFLCRECGRWFSALPQHLGISHQLTVPRYRARYALDADVPLRRTPDFLAAMAERERVWADREVLRNRSADHLEEFRRRFGHLAVPARYRTEDGFQLGTWIASMRTRYRERILDSRQIAALEAIGMLWRPPAAGAQPQG